MGAYFGGLMIMLGLLCVSARLGDIANALNRRANDEKERN